MADNIVLQIKRLDLERMQTPKEARVADLQHLASYNWLEADGPTIAVPGKPHLWTGSKHPRRLRKDSGLVYIAQNAARHPDSPLEPLFRSLLLENPEFDMRSIDVVSDRNNIRKLLTFVDPEGNRNGLESFTIRAELAGKTVILSRKETLVQEIIGRHDFRGYGHEFEKAYTQNEITGSTGHHRIISYRFDTLNIIIRHETDGYVAKPSPQQDKKEGNQASGLAELLSTLSLHPTESMSGSVGGQSKLKVRTDGEAVSRESTLEIKTRISHKPMAFEVIAPQLWVSQTPNLVRAYHTKGVFDVPEVENVSSSLLRWEDDHQRSLTRLAALLKQIITAVHTAGRALIQYDAATDRLIVQKSDVPDMLPADLYSMWNDVHDDEPPQGSVRSPTSI